MGKWFWYQPAHGPSVRVQWLEQSPIRRASFCDRCNARVGAKEPRLRVDNGQGKERKRGKGKSHQYICQKCARDVPNADRDQEQLF